MYIVLVTAPKNAGVKLAEQIVKYKLAACANVVPGLKSVFWWKNKIEKEEEELIVFKTCKEKYGELEDAVKRLHPYDTPEIVAFETAQAEKYYLDWIFQTLSCKED